MSSVRRLLTALNVFFEMDSRMSATTGLVFLEIARAHRDGEEISIHDVKDKCNLKYRDAARHTYYWGDGTRRSKSGGHRLIRVKAGFDNKNDRYIKLTKKGVAVADQLVCAMQGGDLRK